MKKLIIGSLLIGCTLPVLAEDIKVSGFISQSYIQTSKDISISGNSEHGTFQKTEAGIYASKEINDNVDVRGMISAIKDGNVDNFTPRFNYLLVDLHTDDGSHGVRIGRYSYSYGFYNAPRNNPAYRDWEMPPQGMYREGLRYMTRSLDGVQVYNSFNISNNYTLETEFGYGKPNLYRQEDISQTLDLDKDVVRFGESSRTIAASVYLSNKKDGWVARYDFQKLAYPTTQLDNAVSPYITHTRINYIGVRKYFETSDIILEVMRADQEDSSTIPGYNWGATMGYAATYKYYINGNTSISIGKDYWYPNSADKNGSNLNALTGGMIPAASMYHEGINVVLKYRCGSWTYKAEAHHVKGTNALPATNNNILDNSTPSQYNIVLLNATYRF